MKNFRECCQNWMPRVRKILLEKMLFEKIIIFFFFRLSPKFFWMFGKCFSTGLPKLASRIAEEKSDGKKDFKWKNLFPSFSDFELLIFRLVAEKVGSVLKAAFYVSIGNFCSKTVSERKIFLIFGFSAVKSWIFWRKIWHGCQTSRRHLQKNKRREQNMEKER